MSFELDADLDEAQLRAWARTLGGQLRGGDVLLLRGAMGTGKTTFTRALAEGLGVARPERVCSPTYTICMVHRAAPEGLGLVHVDLFRLGEQQGPLSDGALGGAFEALGLEHDELPGPGRVLVVEWSELWAEPPAEHLSIEVERVSGSEHTRRVRVTGQGPRWQASAAPISEKIQ
ncbi:tRNA (adenosine(37)-N6)-threonylcarbamoyltransferase complex ATPase subunit type 1 TsaE [Pseudenhygromyxa sp. WMMC2535]|uniref:tRNA (adenosine(37)-N6)-threonylcarbamoyltransferase complex ATPase subunit type 1 TsaE n=1 Tax=Pseudenhygromyxa sp. WMMC2535 TaxID=2712867 RepID=UPI001595673E|nr:tRNA (adenosine(37)-N6)-threonylcarbamoyltransferase complex ATPase subunit type 1 TsaE [Pseudenhygromyxa sp. WMMC2535]